MSKVIYMEQTISEIARLTADKPEIFQALLKSGEVRETKTGAKYLVIETETK
jgi:formamidopyrimidine-DNA glycosylase